MPYVAVNKNGTEVIADELERNHYMYKNEWSESMDISGSDWNNAVELPKGSIEKLIGRKLTWEDESVELKEKVIECRCGENHREDAQCLICGEVAKLKENL